jgi:hypothetical protein
VIGCVIHRNDFRKGLTMRMKRSLYAFATLVVVCFFCLSAQSFACDPGNPGCVTFIRSGNREIPGDNIQGTTATVTATIPQGQTGHILEITDPGDPVLRFTCEGSSQLGADPTGAGYAGGCADRHATGTVSYTIRFAGYNGTGVPKTGNIKANTAYAGTTDPGITASITVDPLFVGRPNRVF